MWRKWPSDLKSIRRLWFHYENEQRANVDYSIRIMMATKFEFEFGLFPDCALRHACNHFLLLLSAFFIMRFRMFSTVSKVLLLTAGSKLWSA